LAVVEAHGGGAPGVRLYVAIGEPCIVHICVCPNSGAGLVVRLICWPTTTVGVPLTGVPFR
jgi:hypothetical protein